MACVCVQLKEKRPGFPISCPALVLYIAQVKARESRVLYIYIMIRLNLVLVKKCQQQNIRNRAICGMLPIAPSAVVFCNEGPFSCVLDPVQLRWACFCLPTQVVTGEMQTDEHTECNNEPWNEREINWNPIKKRLTKMDYPVCLTVLGRFLNGCSELKLV